MTHTMLWLTACCLPALLAYCKVSTNLRGDWSTHIAPVYRPVYAEAYNYWVQEPSQLDPDHQYVGEVDGVQVWHATYREPKINTWQSWS
jgi:hypothetical protein